MKEPKLYNTQAKVVRIIPGQVMFRGNETIVLYWKRQTKKLPIKKIQQA